MSLVGMSVKQNVITEISRYFYHETFCYLDTISGKVCFMAIVWWHISATRYEIAIMIILENFRDKTNFPGNSIEIAKCFKIKKIAIFLAVITFFYACAHK